MRVLKAPFLFEQLARLRENRAIHFLALLSVLFLALSIAARSPGLLRVDREITQEVQEFRSGWIFRVAAGFTFWGNTTTLLAVGGLGALFFLAVRRRWAALLCLSTLLGLPFNVWIKELVGRPRPEAGVVEVLLPAIGLSFPSGHAMISLMLYGFLALMAWIHIPAWKPRLLCTVALVLLAFLISISRVYVGAHWMSDVIGGWTAGSFFLLILAEIYKVVAQKELAPRE